MEEAIRKVLNYTTCMHIQHKHTHTSGHDHFHVDPDDNNDDDESEEIEGCMELMCVKPV